MDNEIKHDFELYPLQDLQVLLEHEIKKSRRYKQTLTFIHLTVEADPNTAQTQHAAEVRAIDALNIELRETDIPCRDGNEFLVLLPATDGRGARAACERLEKLLNAPYETHEGISFEIYTFIGFSTISADGSVSASKLMQQATIALNHARANQSRKTAVFSEIR